jgi:hypothetical protein
LALAHLSNPINLGRELQPNPNYLGLLCQSDAGPKSCGSGHQTLEVRVLTRNPRLLGQASGLESLGSGCQTEASSLDVGPRLRVWVLDPRALGMDTRP